MASSDTPKCVLLRGDPLAQEAKGDGAILPGHLLERDTAGTVSVHSTAEGDARPLKFAREEEYMGGGLDTAYATGDQIPFYVAKPGDQFYVVLAAGNNVAINALLESAGNGTFRLVGTAGTALVRAIEAVNSGGATARIKVEVL